MSNTHNSNIHKKPIRNTIEAYHDKKNKLLNINAIDSRNKKEKVLNKLLKTLF